MANPMFEFVRLSVPKPHRRLYDGFDDYDPHGPWVRKTLPPIKNIVSFIAVHRTADARIKRYLEAPRKNYIATASTDRFQELRTDLALFLSSNNADARIVFAQTAYRHIEAAATRWAEPLFYVTLTPAACARKVGDGGRIWGPHGNMLFRRRGPAATFDIKILQTMARQVLGTIPFIGMVEATLWRRWGPRHELQEEWISWHCHLIVWNTSRPALEAALKPFRAKHRSLKEGVSPAFVQDFTKVELAAKVFYALKAPQKGTDVKFFGTRTKHPITGKMREPGWHMQKDWLQTGQRVRLLDVIGDRKLDGLLFGNGAGTALANAIRADALTTFHAWRAEQRRRGYRV